MTDIFSLDEIRRVRAIFEEEICDPYIYTNVIPVWRTA